jgi:hypothetical protein
MSERERQKQGGAFVALHPTNDVAFPQPVMLENKYFFHRRDFENYKRALAGLPPLPLDPKSPIVLVKLATVAKELDRHPLSVKRMIGVAPKKTVKRRARSLAEA